MGEKGRLSMGEMRSSGGESSPWEEFRRHMPVAARWAYFDHAAVAPLPASAQKALLRWARQAC
ncbi:MAG: hypothetical protein HQ526_08370 [Actinobacteria bacterium]|nr:hypothetical protein [Actinomycetota bacterium]